MPGWQPHPSKINHKECRSVSLPMGRIAAFFLHLWHKLLETFSDDATGKLTWTSFMGIYMVREICFYVARMDKLSDPEFIAFVALTALFVYGPTVNLTNYFKGVFGGFKTPETQITSQDTQVASANTTVNSPPKDINDANPDSASTSQVR